MNKNGGRAGALLESFTLQFPTVSCCCCPSVLVGGDFQPTRIIASSKFKAFSLNVVELLLRLLQRQLVALS